MKQIRNNSTFIYNIKECIDSSILNLKKKFNLDDINININNINRNKAYLGNKFNKLSLTQYKSHILYSQDKVKSKSYKKPFLIFDVLEKAYKRNNL